jgi:hypothetical protein
MPSKSNHSPATAAGSSAGYSPSETAEKRDPFAALIRQSEQATAAWLLEVEADPARLAALEELADRSARAADLLLAQRQTDGRLLGHHGELP